MIWKPNRLQEFEALSPDIRRRVEAICERFEAALHCGEPIKIEDLVREYGEEEPSCGVLLCELLLLDGEHFPRQHEEPTKETLFARFPRHKATLSGLLDIADRCCKSPSPDTLLLGEITPLTIGHYLLKRELGRGGFGTVFLATDPSSNQVAIKIPHPAVLVTPGLKEWFIRETDVAASLDHPNIVKFIEAGDSDRACYLVTEFVPGPSLATWLAELGKPADPRVAAQLLKILAGAVEHAHLRGVLHRDLKPANVLLENCDPLAPRLTDFGLARLTESSELSVTGLVVGTPAYMAPEQARGNRKEVSARTDVYALGAILYEMLSGSPPFTGQRSFEILNKVITEEPKRLRSLNPHLPIVLETICLKCLEKDPGKRYPSAAKLAEDLQRFLDGKPIAATRVGVLGRTARWSRREPMVARLAGSLLLVFLVAIGGLTYLWLRASEQALETQAARTQAEANFELTRQVTADLLRVIRSPDMQIPGVRDLALDTLTRAEAMHRHRFLKSDSNSAINATLADVYLSLGNLYWIAGREDQANHYLSEAVKQWDRLPAEDAQKREHRSGMAQTYLLFARTLEEFDQPEEAIARAREALKIRSDLQEEFPGHDTKIAQAITAQFIGELLYRTGRFKEFQAVVMENIDFLDRMPQPPDQKCHLDILQVKAQSTHLMGEFHHSLGNEIEARKWWRNTYDYWKKCLLLSDDEEHSLGLAESCLARTEAGEAADDLLTEAIPHLDRIVQRYFERIRRSPNEKIYYRKVHHSQALYHICCVKLGHINQAIEKNRHHLDSIEKLWQSNKTNPEVTFCLVRSIQGMASLQFDRGDKKAALGYAKTAASILQNCNLSPNEGREMHFPYFHTYFMLTNQIRLFGDLEEAAKIAQITLRECEKILNQAPQKAYRWDLLSEAWLQITKNRWQGGSKREILEAYSNVISNLQHAVELAPSKYSLKRKLAERFLRYGRYLGKFGDFDEAEVHLLTSTRLCPSDPVLLSQAAKEMRQLAEQLEMAHPQLSELEQEKRRRYLDSSKTLEERAAAIEKSAN